MIPAKPISMIGPMVQALRQGRKTQTRRMIKRQPRSDVTRANRWLTADDQPLDEWTWTSGDPAVDLEACKWRNDFRTGYLENELRWVRESCMPAIDAGGADWRYAADYDEAGRRGMAELQRWRPPMFMPRRASRITLRVTEVRVQRLHEITAAEAEAEGVVWESADPPFWYVPHIHPHSLTGTEIEEGAVACYGRLWDWINTRPGHRWQDNPWVVAVTFAARQGNVDLLSDGDLP